MKGDNCTGHFYTLASCNPNGCGMPNHMRKLIGAKIDQGLTDRQIFEQLLKEQGDSCRTGADGQKGGAARSLAPAGAESELITVDKGARCARWVRPPPFAATLYPADRFAPLVGWRHGRP